MAFALAVPLGLISMTQPVNVKVNFNISTSLTNTIFTKCMHSKFPPALLCTRLSKMSVTLQSAIKI